jgi:hypothetical protein
MITQTAVQPLVIFWIGFNTDNFISLTVKMSHVSKSAHVGPNVYDELVSETTLG